MCRVARPLVRWYCTLNAFANGHYVNTSYKNDNNRGNTRSVKRGAFSRKAAAAYQLISAEHHQRQAVNEMSATTSYDTPAVRVAEGHSNSLLSRHQYLHTYIQIFNIYIIIQCKNIQLFENRYKLWQLMDVHVCVCACMHVCVCVWSQTCKQSRAIFNHTDLATFHSQPPPL